MQGLTPYNLKIVSEVLGGKSYPLGLLELLDENPLVVDLGANIGSFSVVCRTLRPDTRIVAVEPDPNNFQALRSNVHPANAELHQAALTDHDGEIQLYLGDEDAVTNSVFSGNMASGRRSVNVKCRDAATFLDEIFARHGRIALLKSDTEGGEWHLLRVPARLIADIPVIFIEYHSSSFLEQLLGRMLSSHVIYSGSIRFPHRGEMAFLRKDLLSAKQATFEIRPRET